MSRVGIWSKIITKVPSIILIASNFKKFDLKAKSREAPLGLKRIVTVFKAQQKGSFSNSKEC
jgi:hypothetical protein